MFVGVFLSRHKLFQYKKGKRKEKEVTDYFVIFPIIPIFANNHHLRAFSDLHYNLSY